MYRSGPECTQPQQFPTPPVVASDPVFTQYQSDTQPRMPATCAIAEQAYTHTPPHMRVHTFPRSLLEPSCTQSTVTSALPCQPTGPGDLAFIDNTVQRSQYADSNVYKHSIDQLLADLPPPPHIFRQPKMPLSSVYTDYGKPIRKHGSYYVIVGAKVRRYTALCKYVALQ